ncbi:unnamed protein product [Closterium sp. Yama58-4]|nr:unnamed protein product [Closterium sp. Yama58-4]
MANAGENTMTEGSGIRLAERRGSGSTAGGAESSRGAANGLIDGHAKASSQVQGDDVTVPRTVVGDSSGNGKGNGNGNSNASVDTASTSTGDSGIKGKPRDHGGRQSGAGPAFRPNQQIPMPTLNRARFGLPAICLDLAVLPSGSAGSPSSGSKAAHARAGADGRFARSASSGISAEEETGEIVGTEEEPMDVRARKQKFLFFEKECSQIMAHVFVGSDAVARDREILRKSGITHVLNCVGFVCPEYFPGDITYKTLWLQDNTSEDIACVLYDVFDFIEVVRQEAGRVFVHCCQGVSRSTSLVIAYLMWTEKPRGFEDAFRFVKAIRGVASPNMGFACQLLQWQERVLPPSALPPAHQPLLDGDDAHSSGQDGEDGEDSQAAREEQERERERQRERERERESVVRVYRMAPHSPYDAVHLVPKAVLEVGPRCLDPRGAFVIQVGRTVYTWKGTQCHALMAEQAERAARQLVTYEGLSPYSPSPVLQGAEPAPLLSALHSHASRAGRRAEQQSEYDYDYECFLRALDGGTPKPIAGLASPNAKVLPHHGRGWLGATLDDCWGALAAGGGGGVGEGESGGGGDGSEGSAVRLHSRSFSVGHATLPSLFPVPPSSASTSAASASSKPAKPGALSLGAADSAGGGGSATNKPLFAPVLRKPLPSLPSPSSFSPRSLGFFPPSGVGAYGAALQKLQMSTGGGLAGLQGTSGGDGEAGGQVGAEERGVGEAELHGSALGGSPLNDMGMVAVPGAGAGAGAGAGVGVEEEEESSGSGEGGVGRVSRGGGDAGSWMLSPRGPRNTPSKPWEAEEAGQGAAVQEERREREARTRGARGEGSGSGSRERSGAASARPLPPKPSLPSGMAPAGNAGPSAASSSSGASRATLPPKGRSASPLRPPRPQQTSGAAAAVPRGGGRGVGVGGMADGFMDGGGGGEEEDEEDGSGDGGGRDMYGALLTPRRKPPVSAFGRERGARKGRDGGEGSGRRGRGGSDEDKWGGDGGEKGVGGGSFGGEDGGFGVPGMEDEGESGGMGSDDESGGGMAFSLPTPRRGGPQIKKIF